MGFFDRFRRQDDGSLADFVSIVRRAVEQRSPETFAAFQAALGTTTLLLATANLPPGAGETPTALEEDAVVSVLSTTNGDGETFVLAFTTPEQLQARTPGTPFVGMSAEDALRLGLNESYAGVVIDPAGRWIELRRETIQTLLP